MVLFNILLLYYNTNTAGRFICARGNYKCYSQYRNYEKYHNHTGGERGKGYTQKMGRKGDTYNEIIKRLIKRSEYIEFMEEQYRILNGEKEWTSIDEI